MTLQHGNRIRRTSGKQIIRELQAAESDQSGASGPTEVDIERRAYEIYLNRNGAPGDPVADWLQAEREVHAARAAAPPH